MANQKKVKDIIKTANGKVTSVDGKKVDSGEKHARHALPTPHIKEASGGNVNISKPFTVLIPGFEISSYSDVIVAVTTEQIDSGPAFIDKLKPDTELAFPVTNAAEFFKKGDRIVVHAWYTNTNFPGVVLAGPSSQAYTVTTV